MHKSIRDSKTTANGHTSTLNPGQGLQDKKPFYSMKKPSKQVNFDEPKNMQSSGGIAHLHYPITDNRPPGVEKQVLKTRPHPITSANGDPEKHILARPSISKDKSLKRFLSKKDLTPETTNFSKPKPKKTPDKTFNVFSSKVNSGRFETPDTLPKKPPTSKILPEKSKTPTKRLISNEKPNSFLPRPHPYPEIHSNTNISSYQSLPKKQDENGAFHSKPFLQGIFNVLSKSKERSYETDHPNKSAHSHNIPPKVIATSKTKELNKSNETMNVNGNGNPKDISESGENLKDLSKQEAISEISPIVNPSKKVVPGSSTNIRNSSYDKKFDLRKSLSKKTISISPSPQKESISKNSNKSSPSNSLNRKSISPGQINKKVRERSEIAQNSFKMNLQDLIKLDEIFTMIISNKTHDQSAINFDLLRHFIVNNYCFILKDLNLLFYNEKFREIMRTNYLKELLYFVLMYIILFKNHLEFLAIQKKIGGNTNAVNQKNGKGSDRLSIRGYISSVNQETEELILQVLSYIHIVFILRTEIFMDRAAVYYQNHKTYRELQLLLSKRKSKYNINSLKKENYDHFVYKMNRYLDLCEQALHELFKLNPAFREISEVLGNSLIYLTARTGELSIRDFNNIFAQFKISFDSKGLTEFDLSPILSLVHSENGHVEEEEMHEVEIPTTPFLKKQRPPHKPLTLVIDLDETLIHYPDEHMADLDRKIEIGNFLIRPHCFEFLEQLAQHYELVIFTAASQNYADLIIDHIDPKELISHRLYRQHLTVHNNKLIKDLSKIGRDLNSVIILDNMPENFMLQPDNGIYIKSWRGDVSDKCLLWLLPVFVNIANMKAGDVRDVMLELKKLLVETIK